MSEEIRGIRWINTFDGSGYGVWGRRNVFALMKSKNYIVKVRPRTILEKTDALYGLTQIPDPTEDMITVHNMIPLYPITEKKSGYCTATEIGRPPDEMIYNTNNADFVLTLSDYTTEVYKKVVDNPEKVFPVNFPIPKGLYTPEGPKISFEIPQHYKFKFLFVGRIDIRKNIPTLIQAFKDVFGHKKDVCLLLKLGSPIECIPKWIMDQRPTQNIFWIPDYIADMEKLYRSVNSYVCADLGEGWGAPCCESMLSGIPVIMPRHSGHLSYGNDKNSYLIDVGEWDFIGYKENKYPQLLPPFGRIKHPNIDSLKEKLKEVYDEFKGIKRNEYIKHPKIKEALKIQEIVDYPYVYKQLDKAFTWVYDNVE